MTDQPAPNRPNMADSTTNQHFNRVRSHSTLAALARGLTLIEVLIVISILGVLLGLVSLNLRNDQRQNYASAEQLSARINHATLLATLRGNAMGLSLSNQSYQFWEQIKQANIQGSTPESTWLISDQRGLKLHQLRENQQLELQLEQTTIALTNTQPGGPQLFFPASGELPDFTISLGNIEHSHHYQITSDPSHFLAIITDKTGFNLSSITKKPDQ